MRYFIELSYKGTAYNGWQKQNNSLGVQQVLEVAMSKILRTTIELTGSSRTDTGVHAEQQFAHFDFQEISDTTQLVYNINGMIPFDLAVKRIFPVPDDTNSRFAATYRRYEYRISRVKNPFLINQVYMVRADLDIPAMNEAASLLFKYDDFESFCKLFSKENDNWKHHRELNAKKIRHTQLLSLSPGVHNRKHSAVKTILVFLFLLEVFVAIFFICCLFPAPVL